MFEGIIMLRTLLLLSFRTNALVIHAKIMHTELCQNVNPRVANISVGTIFCCSHQFFLLHFIQIK